MSNFIKESIKPLTRKPPTAKGSVRLDSIDEPIDLIPVPKTLNLSPIIYQTSDN